MKKYILTATLVTALGIGIITLKPTKPEIEKNSQHIEFLTGEEKDKVLNSLDDYIMTLDIGRDVNYVKNLTNKSVSSNDLEIFKANPSIFNNCIDVIAASYQDPNIIAYSILYFKGITTSKNLGEELKRYGIKLDNVKPLFDKLLCIVGIHNFEDGLNKIPDIDNFKVDTESYKQGLNRQVDFSRQNERIAEYLDTLIFP